MERRTGIADMFRALPIAHQVMIGIAGAVLAMAAFLFYQWVSVPSYTVLYSGLDDQALSTVVEELDRQGIPYQLDGGGSQVLVPRSQVYQARADLATAGVRSGNAPQGYELLDGQGLNVSDFRQRVDYQRALEGELSKTLLAMRDISSATVHLVIPEETLFLEDEEPVTASVLISTAAPLGELQVETITFLVASSVEGLESKDVTVADTDGNVLHAAGQIAESSAVSNRNLRMTGDYEAALAADVRRLLDTVVEPGSASVVVRAELNFDEQSTESETYDPDSSVALREQTIDETYSGTGTPPGGTLGVDGEEVITEETDGYTYDRSEAIREYGIDRVVTRSVVAPGQVEKLSVAVVMDDGSLTGAPVPPISEVEALITAAVGLDTARGDSISVSAVAFPPAEEVVDGEAAAAAAPMDIMSLIPQIIGGLVLLIVAVALMIMSRGGKKNKKSADGEVPEPAALPVGAPATRELVGVGAGPADRGLHPEVMTLVQKQPEEIAVLLRSWLADRR